MQELDITNQSLIENIICLPFKQLYRFEMDKKDVELLMTLLLADKNIQIPQKEKPFLVQIIEKRIEHCFSFKMNDIRLSLFLASITKSPGTTIMYLWYLQFWCYKNNIRELDLDIFCKQIFPMGFPSDNDLNSLWDNQKFIYKNNTVNLVDFNDNGLSIQFK